jgi:hypothetical protein
MSVEASLRRLQNNFSGFVAPSTPLGDINALKVQIELRRRALQDIALIRGQLGTFREKKVARRRIQNRRAGRSPLVERYRAGPIRWQA